MKLYVVLFGEKLQGFVTLKFLLVLSDHPKDQKFSTIPLRKIIGRVCKRF